VVLLCLRDRDAVETASCGAHAYVEIADAQGAIVTLPLGGKAAFAQHVDGAAIETRVGGDVENATPVRAVIQPTDADTKPARFDLAWRHGWHGYGHGRGLWLPMPMLTSDWTMGSTGYRLGLTPIAIGLGTRWSPSATSRGYLGTSLFVGWNLLVPNDTQTLSNGTFVRINYEAVGGGVLFDVSGWIGLGVGVGHTFTTDARTDLRTWLWVGPRLLSLFGA
jgi:hypothetical protein